MPIPFILGGIAAVSGLAGVGGMISAKEKKDEAKDTINTVKSHYNEINVRLDIEQRNLNVIMNNLGKKYYNVICSFERYSDVIEQIQNKPIFKFKKFENEDFSYDVGELKEINSFFRDIKDISGGIAVGTFAGLASSGLTYAGVQAIGVASTGTAISTLTGVAVKNAALAWLGGGALSVGGGGMALGSLVLNGITGGVGLLATGFIMDSQADKALEEANEYKREFEKTKDEAKKVFNFFEDVKLLCYKMLVNIDKIYDIYLKKLERLEHIVLTEKKHNYLDFTEEEKILLNNVTLLVGILFRMTKVGVIINSKDGDNSIPEVNKKEVDKIIELSKMEVSNILE